VFHQLYECTIQFLLNTHNYALGNDYLFFNLNLYVLFISIFQNLALSPQLGRGSEHTIDDTRMDGEVSALQCVYSQCIFKLGQIGIIYNLLLTLYQTTFHSHVFKRNGASNYIQTLEAKINFYHMSVITNYEVSS